MGLTVLVLYYVQTIQSRERERERERERGREKERERRGERERMREREGERERATKEDLLLLSFVRWLSSGVLTKKRRAGLPGGLL